MAEDRLDVDVVGHIVVREGTVVESKAVRFSVRRAGDEAIVEIWEDYDTKVAEQLLPWDGVREFIVTHFRPQRGRPGPKPQAE